MYLYLMRIVLLALILSKIPTRYLYCSIDIIGYLYDGTGDSILSMYTHNGDRSLSLNSVFLELVFPVPYQLSIRNIQSMKCDSVLVAGITSVHVSCRCWLYLGSWLHGNRLVSPWAYMICAIGLCLIKLNFDFSHLRGCRRTNWSNLSNEILCFRLYLLVNQSS